MISISSILNKHGIGTLYFGVKPNGDICGQDVSESSLRDVSRSVYESIRPQIYPAIEEVVLDGKHLIKVEFNGNNTPYSAAGRYYLRTSDEDREVTPEELKTSSFQTNTVKSGKNLPLPHRQSDIPSVTLDVALNGTEMAVLAILKQKPDSSRGEIADKISKTVRTVQRALDSLRDKGYIQRVGSKQEPRWEVLK